MTDPIRIKRQGTISFVDAGLSIMEENVDERSFKAEVFKRINQQLRRLGWSTEVPEDLTARYGRSFAERNRYCRKGDLQADLRMSGRCIELSMWQDVANITHVNGGKYQFDKEEAMPYLLRLEMERTRRKIRTYLLNIFDGYTFNDRRHRSTKRIAPGSLTAMQWIENDYRECWHYKPALGRRDGEDRCGNNRSADNGTIQHGARVYTTDYKGRIITGIAMYNINSMWWVVTGKYNLENAPSSQIYVNNPGEIRRKRNERLRRQRLESELSHAVKRMDFLRAHTLKQILWPAKCDQLYLLWEKKHELYHNPNFSGYTRDTISAGRFTWDELKGYRPKDGSLENECVRVIPLTEAA